MLASRAAGMLFGLAEGITISAAFAAFLSILDIVPRLGQAFGRGAAGAKYMEASIVAGLVTASAVDGLRLSVGARSASHALLAAAGAGMGMFVGMLGAALAEVLNVLPVLGRRTGLTSKIRTLVYALVAGKVAGSLLYWLRPGIWQ